MVDVPHFIGEELFSLVIIVESSIKFTSLITKDLSPVVQYDAINDNYKWTIKVNNIILRKTYFKNKIFKSKESSRLQVSK